MADRLEAHIVRIHQTGEATEVTLRVFTISGDARLTRTLRRPEETVRLAAEANWATILESLRQRLVQANADFSLAVDSQDFVYLL